MMRRRSGWMEIGFWGAFFVFVGLWIDPRLLYTAFGRVLTYPEIEWTREFAVRVLPHPGGAVEWLAGLVSQMFISRWFGAAAIAGFAVILGTGVRRLVTGSGVLSGVAEFVPGLIVLAAYSRYGHPLVVCLTLGAGVWAAVLLRRIQPQSIPAWGAVFCCLSIVVGLAASTGVWLLAVIAIIDAVRRRRFAEGLIAVILTPAVLIGLGDRLSGWTWQQSLTHLFAFNEGWPLRWQTLSLTGIQLIWVWPVVVVLVDGVIRWMAERPRPQIKSKPAKAKGRNPAISWIGATMLVACVPAILRLSWDRNAAGQLEIIRLAEGQQWTEVLAQAASLKLRAWNPYVLYEVNRALAHAGRMGEAMFAYPQSMDGLLLTVAVQPGDPELTYNINLLIEVGCINMAEHGAMELLEIKGNLPFVLEGLAKIYLVKNSPETARVFLNKLAKIPAHRGDALRRLGEIDGDPEMTNHEEIRRLRASVSDRDTVAFNQDMDALFGGLLAYNSRNRMAFDYRMAAYLLSQQVDKVAAHIPELEAFGETVLPRHYAEAVAIHRIRVGGAVPLGRFEVPREIEQRARAFLATYNTLKGDRARAMQTLAGEYGDSYFYFYTFGVSGMKK
jgi:hypothetical protein